MKNPFAILLKARVLPAHFGRHFGFQRVAVSMWVHGRARPHHLHAQQALEAAGVVQKAYDAGLLPVDDRPRASRFERFVGAIRAMKKT